MPFWSSLHYLTLLSYEYLVLAPEDDGHRLLNTDAKKHEL